MWRLQNELPISNSKIDSSHELVGVIEFVVISLYLILLISIQISDVTGRIINPRETKPGRGIKQSGWLMSPTLKALECLHAHPHYGRLSIFLEPLSNSSTRQNKVKRKMYALIIFGCSSNQQPSVVHSFFSVNFTCCMYAFLFWGNIWWHPCLTLFTCKLFFCYGLRRPKRRGFL